MLISLFLCTAPFSPDQLAQMSKRFAPVEISADVSALPDNERAALAKPELQYFLINKGPWSRLDHEQAFVSGVPEKPAGASFYPADATKTKL